MKRFKKALMLLLSLVLFVPSVNVRANEGGVLNIGLAANPSSLDPVTYTSQYESNVIRQYGDTLITYTHDLQEFAPSLATEWEVSEDGLVYTFKLRDDVYFQKGEYQDGRQMTAEDVKYSLERSAFDSALNRLSGISGVEVVDDFTVEIHLDTPNSALLTMLTDPGNIVVPKEEVEGKGDSFAQSPIGTGPFQVKNVQLGQQVELVRNDNYWGERPNLDGVTFKIITEGNMMANSLMSGDIHIATDIKGQNREVIDKANGVDLISIPGFATSYLDMNMKEGPTADPKVREAIYMATNVEEIVAGVNQWGGSEVSNSPLPKASWGYFEEAADYIPEFDPEAAKALLDETEYAGGFEIDLYCADSRVPVATIFQQQMAQNLNIKVNINTQEWGTYSETVSSGKAPMNIGGWSWAPDPYFYLNHEFHSDSIGSLGNGRGYSNPEVDKLLDEALKETDQDKRTELYHEVQKIVLQDHSRIELELFETTHGVSEKVEGYSVSPNAWITIVDNQGTNVSLKN